MSSRDDFETPMDRRNSGSRKWDAASGELPMTTADMDFRAVPEIAAALADRVRAGDYGYERVTDEFYDAVAGWCESQHGWTPDRGWLLFCQGVVPAIASIVRSLSNPGDGVAMMTPVYNAYFRAVEDNGRTRRHAIDWEKPERALSGQRTSLMILCNPHNPIG